jgi:hypothetical protein
LPTATFLQHRASASRSHAQAMAEQRPSNGRTLEQQANKTLHMMSDEPTEWHLT